MHSVSRFINDCRKYRHYFWYSTKAELKSSVAHSFIRMGKIFEFAQKELMP